MSSQIDRVTSLYRSLIQIPSFYDAKLTKNGSSVVSCWVQNVLESDEVKKIYFTYDLDEELKVSSDSGYGIDLSNEVISALSPSETYRAVVKFHVPSGNQILEVWQNRFVKQSINLSLLNVHGAVYFDGNFGSFQWNRAEDKFLYVAEKKLTPSEPFYERQPMKPKPKAEDEVPTKGTQFDYKPDWGEGYPGRHLSSIAVVDLKSEKCIILEGVPENLCPGQVIWSPDSTSIVGVAWDTEPRRLGLISCTNRSSVIFRLTTEGEYTAISRPRKAVRFPRFSNDGEYLYWLQRDEGGPHFNCDELVRTRWPYLDNAVIETVIGIVDEEIPIEDQGTFTGIYALGIPRNPFADDGKRMIFSTPQRDEIRPFVFNTESGKITDISEKTELFTIQVMDVQNDVVLAFRTSFTQPIELIAAKLPAVGEENTLKWVVLENNVIDLPDGVKDLKLEKMKLTHEGVQDEIKDFTAMLLTGSDQPGTKRPLIVNPHGGPHFLSVNAFTVESALYCLLGFSVLHVNFRGSIGAGRKSLEYLLGKIGDADVKDCVLATDVAIRNHDADADNCFAYGISHGAFLAAHLSGQYPDKYKAVVAGNGPNDVYSMMTTSDIPDWSAVEVGEEYNVVGPATEELMLKTRRASPLVHAHKVKAPTLICVGSKDRRVPFSQGIDYYHKIRANGCKTRMLVYDDSHNLMGSPKIDFDRVVNSALWFLEHLDSGKNN